MRDLLFKNLTSNDRRRKIIVSSEVSDKDGVHSVIRRHFSCQVRQITDPDIKTPSPYIFVLKKRDAKERLEHFFCKIKNSLLAVSGDKLYLISFIHTLNIALTASNRQIKA